MFVRRPPIGLGTSVRIGLRLFRLQPAAVPQPAQFASSSFASKAADSAGDEPQSASRSAFRREPKYAGAVQDLGHQKAAYHRYLRSAPPPQQQRQKWRTSGDTRFGNPGDRADSFGGGRSSFQRTAGGFGGDQRQPAQAFGARLSPVDWEAAELPPIKKAIYAEDARVAARSAAEIDEWKAANAVTLKGANLPRPVLAFDEAGFPKEIQERLVAHYKQPTVIQSISWPVALSGHDMISIARTGSGKTLGFILPAILHTVAQPRRQPGGGPSVLVLLPTRELAQQVQQVARDFCQPMGLTTTCLFGGAPKPRQADELRRGVDICIATPGRLMDFLESGTTTMNRCTFLVLDEADRMLDMGFEPQIRKVVSQIRNDRQTLMFSATWPKEVRTLAADFQRDPVFLNVGSMELAANHNIEQVVEVVDEYKKKDRLFALLKDLSKQERAKAIIFVQTKQKADDLTYDLRRAGLSALCIHGDKAQSERDWVLSEFRSGKTSILLATDVAARGLDVSDITHVFNFDYPNNSEDYVHRIGRTARHDKKGTAHTFFTPADAPKAHDLIKLLQEANQPVPKELLSLPTTSAAGRSGPGGFPKQQFGRSRFDGGNSRFGGGGGSRFGQPHRGGYSGSRW